MVIHYFTKANQLVKSDVVAEDGLYPDNGGVTELKPGCDPNNSQDIRPYNCVSVWYVKKATYAPGSTTPTITMVNGTPFLITVFDMLGNLVGNTNNPPYGTISGTTNNSYTTLSGTLTGVPNTFTEISIGSAKIRIRGVSKPVTQATASFY